VLVREGEAVAPGQLLLELDPRDFQPRVDQALADVAELEAELTSERQRHESDRKALQREREILALARAEVDRAERLQAKNLGSDSALDLARQEAARQALVVISREFSVADHESRMGQLEARLLRARAELEQRQLELERSRLEAPFAGLISRLAVAPGDRVRTADVMLELYDPEALELRARIPAPYRDELHQSLSQGQPVLGYTRLGDSRIELSLERLSGAADPRGIDGLFRVDKGLRWLRLGEMLEFQLQRPPRERALALPYQALYGGNRIYLLEEGRMRGVQIEPLGSLLDENGEERLLVASGEIQAGDRVITSHLPNAVTGLRAEAVD
jgi:HlyD family secretion protein